MEVVESLEGCKGTVLNALIDVIINHTTITLYHAMMFMSDDAQNKLVEAIIKQKDIIQSARLTPKTQENRK